MSDIIEVISDTAQSTVIEVIERGPAGPAGAGGVTVREVDGTPSATVTTLEFPNGRVTIDGGKATIDVGSSLTVREADGTPTGTATELVLPNGSLSFTGSVATLSYVLPTDSRLADSREWTASTISQAEAEAGTETTRRAFTAQRVRQAIDAANVVGNTLFVDTENGNDSTGTANGSKPYLTIAAARSAASSGDTIVVRPGTYSVSATILKNGVNYRFEPGSIVNATGLASPLSDDNTAIACDIDGMAVFVSVGDHTLYVRNPLSAINVRCKSIISNAESRGAVVASAGRVSIECDTIANNDYDNIITINDSVNSPEIFVRCNRLTPGVAGDAIECSSGKVTVIANRVDASGDIGIWASAGTVTVIVNDLDAGCAILEDGGVVNVLSFSTVAAATHNHDASAITAGTLADARLSANIPRMVSGLIQASNLPSYVDDVLEFANLASFPASGETGKIYVALNNNLTYRWSGSAYVEISPSSAVWGSISGTLSSQTDLQSALDAKLNASTEANSLLGNNTGSTAPASALTASQVRTLLGLATTDSPTFAGLLINGGITAQSTTTGTIDSTSGTGFNARLDWNLGLLLKNSSGIRWSSGNSSFAGHDLILVRDAANTFHQRNGTNAQIARWAKTWTSLTNNEVIELDCAGNATTFDFAVCSGSAGGTNRGLRFGSKYAGGAFSPWLSFDNAGAATFSGNLSFTGSPVITSGSTITIDPAVYFNSTTLSGSRAAALNGFVVGSSFNYRWSSTTGANGTPDLGLSRVGTAVEINNGTSGTLRDLSLRDITLVPSSSRTLSTNGQFSIEMTSNTAGNLVYRGSDGTTRRNPLGMSTDGTSLYDTLLRFGSETTQTPTGTTAPITLSSGNHQTLALGSASGNVTVTLTVPASSSAGTIIVTQGATVRDLTWAVSSGTIQWMGGEPDWAADAISTSRMVAWRWNGSVMRLAATEVNS